MEGCICDLEQGTVGLKDRLATVALNRHRLVQGRGQFDRERE